MKGGEAYFVPANEAGQTISSVSKWDQAFRVFSDIYCQANPSRSTELIQYSHVIHSAAATFSWDNVYSYDKDFRLHLAENPGRTWAIILQQAWSMRLRDQINFDFRNNRNKQNNFYNNDGSNEKTKNYCKRFNRGRCTFGSRCRYEHKCTYCFKFGHGMHNCRKLISDNKRDKELNFRRGLGNDFKEKDHHNQDNSNGSSHKHGN